MFGVGGGTNSYREIEDTEVILLWGSNARETHPIFFHHLLKGIHNGARLYTVDPRRTSSARWADAWLGLDVGSDIALANAVGREIIAAGLENREFIEHATSRLRVLQAGRGTLFALLRREGNGRSRAHDPGHGARIRQGRVAR